MENLIEYKGNTGIAVYLHPDDCETFQYEAEVAWECLRFVVNLLVDSPISINFNYIKDDHERQTLLTEFIELNKKALLIKQKGDEEAEKSKENKSY